jgi:hypothetical protein
MEMIKKLIPLAFLMLLISCNKRSYFEGETLTRIEGDDFFQSTYATVGGSCDGGEFSIESQVFSYIEQIVFIDEIDCEVYLKKVYENVDDSLFCETETFEYDTLFSAIEGFYGVNPGRKILIPISDFSSQEYDFEISDDQVTFTNRDTKNQVTFTK